MNAEKHRVSFTDLQQWPEDGHQYELYDGELRVIPSPIPLHQIVIDNVRGILQRYVDRHGGLAFFAPLDIVFSEYDVVQPDVLFFLESRRHIIDFKVAITHRPDLVVEVLSPSTKTHDRTKKLQMFARFEVPEYWIVDPAFASLDVLQCERGTYVETQSASDDDVVHSPLLAPFTFPVSDAFRLP